MLKNILPTRKAMHCIAFLFLFPIIAAAQNTYLDDVEDFLTDMLLLSNKYVSPAAEAAVYQSTGSWYSSAKNLDLYQVDLSLHINALPVSNAQKSKNNCVWLSTILLIQQNDREIAAKMMNMLKEDNASYQWMYLTKVPLSQQQGDEDRNVPVLISALRYPDIAYTLKKIDIGGIGCTYIDFIMSYRTSGQYICQLEAIGGDRKHVIGVDVDRKLILDASESHALRLSHENIDYCVGKNFIGVRKIIYCYELVKRT